MWLKDTVAQTDEESWVIAVKQVAKVRTKADKRSVLVLHPDCFQTF